MRISSPSNEKIKLVNQLQSKASARRKQKMFVVEGIRMYEEIPASDLVATYVSEAYYNEVIKVGKLSKAAQENLAARDYYIVVDSVFKNMSDTVTPQGILAIAKQKEYTLDDILSLSMNKPAVNKQDTSNEQKPGRAFIILESIQDPGNLGTILRTAEGAGVSGIIMNKETVDIYNSKVIRSTMGSVYRVPFMVTDNLPETIDELKKNNVTVFAAHLKGEEYYAKDLYKGDVAFLIGNEGNGLSDEIAKLADKYVKIPMEGMVESLNASVAAAILMYEAKRQRDL